MTCLQSSWGGSKKLYAGKPMQAGYFTRSVRSGIPKLNSGFSSHKLFSVLLVLLNLVLTMAQSDDFARKSTEFYTKLFSAVSAEKQDKNIILSPFSIQTCLALAYMGAGGKTAEEISLGIGLASNNRATVAESFGNILDQYIENPQLKIANKVYVKQNLKLKPDFNEIARKRFYSEAESVDFTKNLDAARTINLWVEQHTNNKIKDVISADSLNDDTRCVLVNAIYFKGLWAKKFNPEATRKDDFYISETETVPVDMMFVNGKFKYGYSSDLDASVLELPYENSSLSMLIILPTKRTGLKDLESKINEKSLEELQKGMYKVEVDVKLPKFKIEFEIQLKPILEKLGMKSMFSQGNFDNLLNTAEPLKVSEVIHKAFIDVNEEGTEAAAATGQIVGFAANIDPTPTFFVNKQFHFILKTNDSIIFNGHLLRPTYDEKLAPASNNWNPADFENLKPVVEQSTTSGDINDMFPVGNDDTNNETIENPLNIPQDPKGNNLPKAENLVNTKPSLLNPSSTDSTLFSSSPSSELTLKNAPSATPEFPNPSSSDSTFPIPIPYKPSSESTLDSAPSANPAFPNPSSSDSTLPIPIPYKPSSESTLDSAPSAHPAFPNPSSSDSTLPIPIPYKPSSESTLDSAPSANPAFPNRSSSDSTLPIPIPYKPSSESTLDSAPSANPAFPNPSSSDSTLSIPIPYKPSSESTLDSSPPSSDSPLSSSPASEPNKPTTRVKPGSSVHHKHDGPDHDYWGWTPDSTNFSGENYDDSNQYTSDEHFSNTNSESHEFKDSSETNGHQFESHSKWDSSSEEHDKYIPCKSKETHFANENSKSESDPPASFINYLPPNAESTDTNHSIIMGKIRQVFKRAEREIEKILAEKCV